MKRAFSLILFLGFAQNPYCQEITIDGKKGHFFYPAIENPLTIVVENIPCEALLVTTDNGKIRAENCEFAYIPKYVGSTKLYVHKILNSDTILLGEKDFIVKPLLTQTVKIGNQTSGKMKVSMLKAQGGLTIPLYGFDMVATIPVTRFHVKIIRANELMVEIHNKGGRFNDSVMAVLDNIRSGDKVIFDNVYALIPGMKVEEKLNIIEIEVE